MSEENSPLRIILIIVAAIVIPMAVVAGYVLINRTPPPYAGQVLSVNIFPIHRDLTQKTTVEGIGGTSDVYDEMLVLANVRIRNVAKIPLFVHDMWAVVNFPDETDRSTAASKTDYDKVFIAYPDLQKYKTDPLPRDITLQPGQEVEGTVVFNYQMSLAQWASRDGMDINVAFLHHPPLVMHVAK